MAIQYRMDRAFGGNLDTRESPAQVLSDLTGTPAGVLALNVAGKNTLAQKELAISRRLREPEEAAESSAPPRAAKQ